MSNVVITSRIIRGLKPECKPYFLRDATLRGFAVKVNPSGSVKFVAEARQNGQTHRKTLGTCGVMDLHRARICASEYILAVKTGAKGKDKKRTLESVLQDYISDGRLKNRTVVDYQEATSFYLSDWLGIPIRSISKPMVEKRFVQIRDKGISGGKPTYSQATKTMRILSALMNYAMADGLIESNPVDILKQKRIDRSIRKREIYLPTTKVRELLDKTAHDNHSGTLAIHLMLHTGLRKNEALRLKWANIRDVEGITCLTIGDTKNHRPHYVPVTPQIQGILDRASVTSGSTYVFPSPQRPGKCIQDIRPTLMRLTKLIDYDFKCHDLRRTFATRASEVGIDYLMIKRMLNHKSNDITGQYIQWHSRQNLIVMRDALRHVQY